jgi:hypothetical protein
VVVLWRRGSRGGGAGDGGGRCGGRRRISLTRFTDRALPRPRACLQFGGVKASGIGREGGEFSLDFYSEWKNVCFATGPPEVELDGGH